MAEPCLACLGEVEGRAHAGCLERLFGANAIPRIDIELAQMHTVGLAMVGKTSLSGAQRKVSLGLSADRLTLRLSVEGEQYILKPASDRFPSLPENERLSMRILEAAGVEVPPLALVPLADGTAAYIVKRFDRALGRKRRQEDFCQLTLRAPKDKYRGSAELCARVVLRYASEPVVELRRLFRRLVAAWLIGDGDLHLKNLSLLRGDDGLYRVSPAYDAVCTRIYVPDDRLALSVRGRDDRLERTHWLAFAVDVGLPRRAAARVLDEVCASRDEALRLAYASGLPAHLTTAYAGLLRERFASLA